MNRDNQPVTIEELAERLDSDRIDWERPHRAQSFHPSRRPNRFGL